MLRKMICFISLLIISNLFGIKAYASLQDGYSCILIMQTENKDHKNMNCQSALLEEKDLMVYLIGQAYINTHRYSEALNFYNSFLGSGYDDGARLGLWVMDRFVYGNKSRQEINLKHERNIKNILRNAMDRSDPMAYYVLKGYNAKSSERVRYMADEQNVYAAVEYIFAGKEPLKDKSDYLNFVYNSGLPIGKVLYSIYGIAIRDESGPNTQESYKLSKEALSEGSSCGNLSLSFFYQSGVEVEKNSKEAARLLKLAKEKCWYAEKNSDLAWR